MEAIKSTSQSTHGEDCSNMDALHEQIVETGDTSFFRTCFNGINALLGVGLLSVPYATSSQGGWLSLALLFMVAALCCYTGLLLQRCIMANPSVRSYPDIGGVAFGPKGRALVAFFLCIELYLVAVELLILEGDNLAKLFSDGPRNFLGSKIGAEKKIVISTALVILPTTWLTSLGVLAFFSMGGVFASLIITVSVILTGTSNGVGFRQKGLLWDFKGMPTSISLFSFCYCGHAVFPTLSGSMKDRRQFRKVLLICFAINTISYATMAIFGYLMYGQHLQSQITLNLPVRMISSQIAIYTTLINPFAKYALMITPVANSIEDQLDHLATTATNRWVIRFVVRTMLVISSAIVAVTVPFFGYVMAFIGAFLGIALFIIFPCLCYLKLTGFQNRLETKIIIAIIRLGLLVGLTGTYISVRDIVINI